MNCVSGVAKVSGFEIVRPGKRWYLTCVVRAYKTLKEKTELAENVSGYYFISNRNADYFAKPNLNDNPDARLHQRGRFLFFVNFDSAEPQTCSITLLQLRCTF